ncbi:MAG: hypothetical protein EZS28_051563, partial [Streblomastix strix]
QLKGKTRKATDTLHANYNENFKFHFDKETQDQDTIQFELWERDALYNDKQIGKAEVPLNYFLDNKEEAEITFEGVNKLRGQNVGVLEAEIEAIPYDDYFTMKRDKNVQEVGTIRRSYLDSHGQTLKPSTIKQIKQNQFLQQQQEQNEQPQAVEEEQVQEEEQQQPIEEITKVDNDCPKGIVEVTVFGVKDVAAMDSNGKS